VDQGQRFAKWAGCSSSSAVDTRGEIHLKQRALDHRGHPRFPSRRVIIFRTPSAILGRPSRDWAFKALLYFPLQALDGLLPPSIRFLPSDRSVMA
jgi:hypothetical protein